MQCNDLKDLELAGVRWEITDLPFVSSDRYVPKGGNDIIDEIKTKNSSREQRTLTSIVPPIEPMAPMSPEVAVAMATRPTDILSLIRMIEEFNHPLKNGATNVVLPFIAPNPNGLLIVMDVPGSEDDKTGKILSGSTGKLVDKMLMAINMSRKNVSILPLVFWRTPGGRTPTEDELAMVRPFIERAIELLNPRIILTLGSLAAKEIANVNLPGSHDKFIELDNDRICVPMFHPNYLLLKPSAKRAAWDALQKIEKLLKNDND